MNNYEAIFIVRPDLSEEERKALCAQISDAVTKNNGSISKLDLWAERKKLFFTIKRCKEGIYYLMTFNAAGEAIAKIQHAYGLNENILRVLISRLE